MNKRLNDEVKKVEQEYIDSGKQFTALDIGNELKKRGVNVRQRDVSPIVREHFENEEMYMDGDYVKEMIPVKDGNLDAFLYSRWDQDAENYTATNQDPLPWNPNKPMFDDKDDISIVVINYVASKRSKILHSPDCMYAVRIKSKNKVTFDDVVDATDNYRVCKRG